MNRTDRLLGYLTLLQGRTLIRARELADRFEVSERTVYRDIQALCEVGVPIASMPGEGYRLMQGYYLPPISFSSEEARSLYLALSLFSAVAKRDGVSHQAGLSSLDKIRAVLPAASKEKLEFWQSVLHFISYPNPPVDFDDPRFLILQQAIEERRVVKMEYHAQSSNEVTIREFEPVDLAYFGSVWLVSGYCRLRREMRSFRLDRIDDFQLSQETFVPKPSRARSCEGKTLEITVRFDREIARWVGERQHYSFVGEAKGDGYVEMCYQVRDPGNLIEWLLPWSGSFEVVSPPSFREQICERAEAVLARHRP